MNGSNLALAGLLALAAPLGAQDLNEQWKKQMENKIDALTEELERAKLTTSGPAPALRTKRINGCVPSLSLF